MKASTILILKISILAISIGLIGYGWIVNHERLALIGAWVYIGKLIFDNIDLIIESRKNKRGVKGNAESNFLKTFINVLEGSLILTSLISYFSENDMYKIPGMIIWLGQISSYILFGLIIEIFADIPMVISHGGVWGIKRHHPRRKRHY